ncbi:alpha-L-fucosidase [Hufsiella ginkgonis]|uniref:alpha-L-fucosidase n=1 Tax=Hufsiella ginkgonis TaxID=2695274 RepID=A0A7K1XVK1_9SPHI|nr:alpha-L-fucosidase [Hufsiella ginkgonis]MXV14837.1 alpha-L-fucosidase [Hufsiella ginkgonis]
MKSLYLSAASCLLFLTVSGQPRYAANWTSIDSRPIPEWYTDAKFGIFIHWGLFSVPSYAPVGKDIPVYSKYAEWYWFRWQTDSGKVGKAYREYHLKNYGPGFKYQDFAKSFTAELFNPDQWAELFKTSGAKYVVLTSKHHEGFTLWPSKESWNWNSVDVGPHRDLAGDLTRSVKARGLHMGFYYSLYEWFNPLYKADVTKYVDEHMLPQMKDLVNRYQPDVFWTDGEWEHPSDTWKSTRFLSWLYNDSPVKNSVVVNDRWGKETRSKHGGFYTTEYDLIHDGDAKNVSIPRPWEECRGIGGSFGLNRNENLEDYSTSAELIGILIEKVARGGNLLLNIGPAADGTIPVIMQQRLTDMGGWLKVNGDAIYGTQEWKERPQAKIEGRYFTRKGKDLYLITTKWTDKLDFAGLTRKPASVTLLGLKGSVKSNVSGSKISITAPVVNPGNMPCNYAWVYRIADCL